MKKEIMYKVNFINDEGELSSIYLDENMKDNIPGINTKIKEIIKKGKLSEYWIINEEKVISKEEIKPIEHPDVSDLLDQISVFTNIKFRPEYLAGCDEIDEELTETTVYDAKCYLLGIKTILDTALKTLELHEEYLEAASSIDHLKNSLELNELGNRLDQIGSNIETVESIVEKLEKEVGISREQIGDDLKQIKIKKEFEEKGKIESDPELGKEIEEFKNTVLNRPEYTPSEIEIIDYKLTEKEIEDYKFIVFSELNKNPKINKNGDKIYPERDLEYVREAAIKAIEYLRNDRDELSDYDEINRFDQLELALKFAKGDLIDLYFSKGPESK